MKSFLAHSGSRAFLLLWIGLTVSLVGSALTMFALGVRIFQQTASTTQYALVMFCAAVPPLVILPLVGPLIDRFDRKRLLIGCDVLGALATLCVGLLAASGKLAFANACLLVALLSSAAAIQWPAYSATVTLLVPREQLGRASGMTQLAHAASQVVSPLAAGALIAAIGLAGIAVIDFATFLFSTAMLMIAAIPHGGSPSPVGTRRSYFRDLPLGWRYISARAGLFALLVMFALVNFFSELASVLFTPFVLSFSTPAALGMIVSVGGIGMLAGGAVMTVWGGPRRAALSAALFAALSGVAVATAGFTTSVPLLAAIVAAFFFCLPLTAGSSQVVWQRMVPVEIQGRVFATRAAIAMSTAPIAPLVAGPLADGIFEPGMSAGGPLAAIFGPFVGVGDGRGIALIFVAAGVLCMIAGIAAALFPPLRKLDDSTAAAPLVTPAPSISH